MRLKITHRTRYVFDSPVPYGLQQIRLTPQNSQAQRVLGWEVQVEGGKPELDFVDYHGNAVTLVSIEAGTQSLSVTSNGEVDVTDTTGVVGQHGSDVPLWLFLRETPLTGIGKGVKDLCRDLEGDDDISRLHALMTRILEKIPYQIGETTPDSSAEDVISAGLGVCQDHAHVFIACARHLGLPARYVSGYLLVEGEGAHEAAHAWAEVHVGGLGWVGFDASNDQCPDDRYVRVATGLDYAEAAPMTGTRFGDSGQTLSVDVEVAKQPTQQQTQQ